MTFAEARAQFPVLERYAYLNAGTLGPLARSVADAMASEQQRALDEGRMNPSLFEQFFPLRLELREAFAALLGVDAANVALVSSTTEACNVVLNGLTLGEGDELVTTDVEHFGVIGPLAVSGATVRVARLRGRPAGEAFDALAAEVTPRTKLLALSDVNWFNGHRLPWRELKDATGVATLVDGAQSVGAIPVDARPADFYTVSAQKWLCGPDLTGALYVAEPDRLRLSMPSYLSQKSYDHAAATFEPQAGAARFDTYFTPLAALRGMREAFALHPEWRYKRAASAAARCRDLLAQRHEVVTEPEHATLVSFRYDAAADAVKRLYEAGVIVRDIPGAGLLRVSCGWWTSDEDLDRLVAAL
jgi:L-cysteine/cystine lyase